MKNFSCMVKI